jgi:hypothetical protein
MKYQYCIICFKGCKYSSVVEHLPSMHRPQIYHQQHTHTHTHTPQNIYHKNLGQRCLATSLLHKRQSKEKQ